MNLNTYRNAHFYKINAEKRKWERLVMEAVKTQEIKGMTRAVVTIIFHFKTKQKRDSDNYATCAKFIFDGLVKAKIITDDNFDIIESLTVQRGTYAKIPYMEVILDGD